MTDNELINKVLDNEISIAEALELARADEMAKCETCIHKVTKADIDAIEEKARAEKREKAIEECKEVVRQHWINGTVAYRIAEEIYGDLEKLKEKSK